MIKNVKVSRISCNTKKKLSRAVVLESWSDGEQTEYIMSGDIQAIRELSQRGYTFRGVHPAVAKVTESVFLENAEIYLREEEEDND